MGNEGFRKLVAESHMTTAMSAHRFPTDCLVDHSRKLAHHPPTKSKRANHAPLNRHKHSPPEHTGQPLMNSGIFGLPSLFAADAVLLFNCFPCSLPLLRRL